MVDVRPGVGAGSSTPGGMAWAEAWVKAARESLTRAADGEHASIAGALAEMLAACGRDEESDSVLSEARRQAARTRDPVAIARVELAHAACAQARDDDARARASLDTALASLERVPSVLAARAWLCEARLARVQGLRFPEMPASLDALEDAADDDDRAVSAEVVLEASAIARETQDWTSASRHLAQARAIIEKLDAPRLRAMYELEAGMYSAEAGDFSQGRLRMKSAAELFGAAGLLRDQGRAIIGYAELLAAHPTLADGESAAVWLGRAQTVLGAAATWRDRLALRTGFRNFGRRVFDRVMTEGTLARIEGFERARAALLSALSQSAETSDRGLTAIELSATVDAQALADEVERVRAGGATGASKAAEAIADIDRSVRDLIDLIGAALVERDRMRMLLDALSEIDAVLDFDSLPPLVARIAARLLEADYVVVALEQDGELLDYGRHGEQTGPADAWRKAAEEALARRGRARKSDASKLHTRSDESLFGPVLAVAVRGRDVAGALYADKLRRSGQFRDQDYAVAHLLSEYVALALGRLYAREQESLALNQLAVTLDAIRDGVVSVDERGIVTSANAAAARMLRVAPEELVGAACARHPVLGPLHALVAPTPRIDGSVLRLAHGGFVVSARPIADDDPARGFVATLVELDRAQKMAQRLSATRARYSFNDIVGKSPMLEAAVAMAKRAAAIDANVLITGESGTGKEVIAQAIHSAGPRANEPFVGINVAALPRELLEAELFGYEKGAFTGARAEGNPGKFELAGNGTILLDEIGDMPLDMQAKLLRVLQERVVTRLGGRQEIPVHARVIATTHRDLDQLVDEGKFRMDLLYRLRVLAIGVPALRDRPEDIADLAQSYLLRFAEQQRKRVRELGPRVVEELERYDWPGNVRELANVMEAEVSLIAPDAEVLDRLATRLVGRFRTTAAGGTGEYRAVNLSAMDMPILPLAEVEKRAFLHALDKMNGNVARAAEALGVSKVTFYAKLRSWGMHPKDRADDEGPQSTRWSTRMRAADALAQTGSSPVAEIGRGSSPIADIPRGPETPKSRT